MRLVKAKLIKRKTDDGLFEIEDYVQLGKEYMVDVDSLFRGTGVHVPTGTVWEREVVFMENGEWFPLELLEILR